MNIAVVGGGSRCKRFIDVIEQHTFQETNPKVVAVADIDETGPGYQKAKGRGIYVTRDYDNFFAREDIDMIIELTGNNEIFNDILSKKKHTVRAIGHRTAALFWEIARVSALQKKTDQELQETRALYKTVINELIQEDVMVIDYNYRIIDANDSLLNKLGLKRDEVLGRNCYKITHHQDHPCSGEHHPCPLIQTLETEKPFQTTHIHRDRRGNEIFYSISTYPLIEDGEVIGAIEISRDITKDIKVQKNMMQQEKLVSIGRLSAGVAHEINNPLTTILTTAMLTQEDLEADDPLFSELEIITKETLRCRKIVKSLLDFARQNEPSMKNSSIVDVLSESIVLTKKQAAFKDVSIEPLFEKDIPQVYMDKSQIQQAIINLLINAIEATSSGGKVTVALAKSQPKGKIAIDINDTGEGIPRENIDTIFEPFFTTKDSGTGLGLAITHGIIEKHGGTISVTSEIGRGTTFSITLPEMAGETNAV